MARPHLDFSSLVVRFPVSGPAPCSGALARRGKGLDEVSAAIPGDAVAGNGELTSGEYKANTYQNTTNVFKGKTTQNRMVLAV